jgi:hypothetical protein
MDIPFPATSLSPDSLLRDLNYTILFDNGTISFIPLQEMVLHIPPPPVGPLIGDPTLSQDSLFPPFLCINSKIIYEHDGQYHKDYLTKHDGTYRFSFKSHVNKRSEDWGIDLPNLVMNWVDLCIKGLLIPGHVSQTFLHSLLSPTLTTSDSVASFFSEVNLHLECPPSLLKGLADSLSDQEIWLSSFFEENQGIESVKGDPKAISAMCIFSVECDENLLPLCAKSRIVVPGYHKDQVWSRSNQYTPMLQSNSLRFLVTMVV